MSGYNIGIGVGLRYIQRGVVDLMAQAIRSSMVVWYDIKRQGATNESMSQNPLLKDLSGHGHDATCYNFAWSGMSGIGGYHFDTLTKWYTALGNDGKLTVNNTKIHITRTTTNSGTNYYLNNNKRVESNNFIDSYTNSSVTIKPFKINVSGLPDGYDIVIDGLYNENVEGSPNQKFGNVVIHNGEHIIDTGTVNLENIVSGGYFHFPRIFTTANMPQIDCDITIEFLPEYPNALVADGVDDYAYVEGLPILTDYTVIAKRKRLDADLNNMGALASKLTLTTANGAFLFEFIQADTGGRQVTSFGAFNSIQMVDTDISYMTKNSYNGTPIKSGQKPDNNHLTLFSTREYSGCAQAALYSFVLFNRTLTDEEIEWVKKNLLGVETPEQKYSCFGTGQWVMKYPWINDDLWKMKK